MKVKHFFLKIKEMFGMNFHSGVKMLLGFHSAGEAFWGRVFL